MPTPSTPSARALAHGCLATLTIALSACGGGGGASDSTQAVVAASTSTDTLAASVVVAAASSAGASPSTNISTSTNTGTSTSTSTGSTTTGAATSTNAATVASPASSAASSASAATGTTAVASAPPQTIAQIQVTGTPVKVFDHARDQQETYNIPDGQVSAWREADGTVDLMIPSFQAYRMRGADLHHLAIAPKAIYSSLAQGGNVAEASHDYHHWFFSPYTLDGTHIYTVAHSEWYACLLTNNCDATAADGNPAEINGCPTR